MRPIERRLAAVEAKQAPSAFNHRVFIPPRGLTDYEAWRQECLEAAGGARCMFVEFVKPGEARSRLLH